MHTARPQIIRRRTAAQRWASLTWLVLLGLVGSPPRAAGDANAKNPTEYGVKAAFLYNFARFVEWPAQAFPDPKSPFVIGLLGQDPFGSVLDRLVQNQAVNGRPFAIKRAAGGEELRDCHVLFISRSEEDRLATLLAGLKGSAVLTVSEIEGFARQGGMIAFVLAEGTVKFEVNLQEAERSGLRISSKLLGVAKSVLKDKN